MSYINKESLFENEEVEKGTMENLTQGFLNAFQLPLDQIAHKLAELE